MDKLLRCRVTACCCVLWRFNGFVLLGINGDVAGHALPRLSLGLFFWTTYWSSEKGVPRTADHKGFTKTNYTIVQMLGQR